MNIKLFTMIAATVCGMSFVSCDDDDNINVSNLPGAIQKEFSTKYPNAQIEEWEQKNGYSVVDFRWDGFEAEAWFGANGWVMTETDIPYQALPEAVKTSFEASRYANWKIEDIDKVERIHTETIYVIEVESGDADFDLYYSSNGILIKDLPDQEDTDNPYLPEQSPSELLSKIKKMYPNAVVVDIDKEDDGVIEIDIIDNNIGKEVLFSMSNEWLYTSWDVNPMILPTVVKAAITMNYPDFEIDDVEFYETPTGNYYDIEIEKGDKDVHIKVSESGGLMK